MSLRRSQPVTAERVNWRTHGSPEPFSSYLSGCACQSFCVFTTLSPRQGCSYRGCAASDPLVPCQGAALRSRCEDHPPSHCQSHIQSQKSWFLSPRCLCVFFLHPHLLLQEKGYMRSISEHIVSQGSFLTANG